jgi:hypothetical protein
MKRFVLLLVCAAVLVCLLAAPAADAKRRAANRQTYRPPVDTAVLFGPGSWFTYSGGASGTTADMIWYQAADPEGDDDPPWQDPYAPIPQHEKVYFTWVWTAGVNYGFMLNTPNRYLFAMDITGPGDFEQHFRPGGVDTDVDGDGDVEVVIDSKVKAYWTGPYLWDEFWAELGGWFGFGTLEPPAIGALLYGQHQMLPIGEFEEAGRYDVHLWMWTERPASELLWKPPHGGPLHSPPYPEPAEESFSFYVG